MLMVRELSALLGQLGEPERLERHPLAEQLLPRLRARYPDLDDAPMPSAIIQGLTRLWQETAGAVPLALAHRKLLEKYFTLMVRYFYPAQHGMHRYRISSDQRIGPVQSFNDTAARLGEREYLALIYAQGDLDQARRILEQRGDVLTALSETEEDGLAVHPNPKTVNSRRLSGIQLLADRVAHLLQEGDAKLTSAAEASQSELPGLVSATRPAQSPAPLDPPLGQQFNFLVQQGQPVTVLAALVDLSFHSLEAADSLMLVRGLAQQLAAIELGLEPTPERTPALIPANARLALRRVQPGLDQTRGGLMLLSDLQTLGILDQQGETWRFVSREMAEWFGAEFVATFAGHRFLPQARYRRLQHWATGLLAERHDDARNALLTEDMARALPGLHPVSLLDTAAVLESFDGRETPSIARFRSWLASEIRRLASIPSGALQGSLARLEPVDGPGLADHGPEGESILSAEELERARAAWKLAELLGALALPESLAGEPRWVDKRPALEALLAQVQSCGSPAGNPDLAVACAAWLQSATLTQTLEVNIGLGWPMMQPVSAAELLTKVACDQTGTAWTRRLALTALASERHLELLLNLDTPEATAVTMSLLLLTDRRAAWNPRAGRWELLA